MQLKELRISSCVKPTSWPAEMGQLMQLKQMKIERCDALELVPLVGVKTTVSVCLSLSSFHIGTDSFVQELIIS